MEENKFDNENGVVEASAGVPVTEVTSIAQEEEKTGQKIPIPPEEELVKKASISLFQSRRKMQQLLINMSKKSVMRTIAAAFDLPSENIPVFLKTEEEKQFYALSQRCFADKFLIIQKHINDEIKKRQEAQAVVVKEETNQTVDTQQTNQEGEVK